MVFNIFATKIIKKLENKEKRMKYFLQKKNFVVPLHPLTRFVGGIAQLVRAHDS